MKIKIVIFPVLICGLVASSGLSLTPPLPLDARVHQGSHVFVGTARSLIARDRNGNIVNPDLIRLDPLKHHLEAEVQVNKVLKPQDDVLSQNIKCWFIGGYVLRYPNIKKQILGKKLIYIGNLDRDGGMTPMLPEPISEEEEISRLVRREK